MPCRNYLIESSSPSFAVLQRGLERLLLGGLDVRITPVGPRRALLPAHIFDALQAQYGLDPLACLRQHGLSVGSATLVPDGQALMLLMQHATRQPGDSSGRVVPSLKGMPWHLANIRAPEAWALLGGPHNIAWTCKVGQIDTGFLPHPALGFTARSTRATSPWLLRDECRNFQEGQPAGGVASALGEDPCTGPFWGHGTRIGATISGWSCQGDAGHAFYGAAPKVPHVMVRISSSVVINDQLDAFAKALNYLVDDAAVDVVNLSMGTFPAVLNAGARQAINKAYDRGVILVCAGGQHVSPIVAPASFGRSIAVGGTTHLDQVWAKTSYGPQIDWSAPAADIRRASINRKGGPFVYSHHGEGTSYAAALSSGAAALWLTHRRAELHKAYREPWMRIAAFKALAKATARRPAVWGPDVAGTGILDVLALLQAPLPSAAMLKRSCEAPV